MDGRHERRIQPLGPGPELRCRLHFHIWSITDLNPSDISVDIGGNLGEDSATKPILADLLPPSSLERKASDQVNARVGLFYEPWDASLTIWGRNLTDEEYTNTIADAPAQTGRFIGYYNEPTTWGVTLRKDF